MLVGGGGNVTVQVGNDGVLLVDTNFAPLAPKIMAAIRKLSSGPVRYVVNHSCACRSYRRNRGSGEARRDARRARRRRWSSRNLNVLNRMVTPPAGNPPVPQRAVAQRHLQHSLQGFLLQQRSRGG